MKRAVSIDNIDFNYPLHISDNFDCDNFLGNEEMTAEGKLCQFIENKGKLTKKVQIYSYDNGWINIATKKKIFKNIDTEKKEIKFNDGSSAFYYYDLVNPIEVTPLFEGATWYKIKINLREA